MQTVILGPGDIDVAHQPNESLPIANMDPTLQHAGAFHPAVLHHAEAR